MRKIEDILKDMENMGMSPDTLDQDIINTVTSIKEHIVSIDSSLNESQLNKAFSFMYECHKREAIKGPVSLNLANSGGIILNRGNFVGWSKEEVATKFGENLTNGDERALRINQCMLGNYHAGGETV